LQEAKAAIEGMPAAMIAEKTKAGAGLEIMLKDGPLPLDAADYTITYAAAEGWAGLADRGTMVALDTRITEELELEGLAREVIRYVQDARKNAKLEMEDRISLNLGTDSPKLQAAIAAHRETIAAETLVAQWCDQPPEGAVTSEVKIDGQPLRIALKRV
jgi:isoleucyl-tRNA synthetase